MSEATGTRTCPEDRMGEKECLASTPVWGRHKSLALVWSGWVVTLVTTSSLALLGQASLQKQRPWQVGPARPPACPFSVVYLYNTSPGAVVAAGQQCSFRVRALNIRIWPLLGQYLVGSSCKMPARCKLHFFLCCCSADASL